MRRDAITQVFPCQHLLAEPFGLRTAVRVALPEPQQGQRYARHRCRRPQVLPLRQGRDAAFGQLRRVIGQSPWQENDAEFQQSELAACASAQPPVRNVQPGVQLKQLRRSSARLAAGIAVSRAACSFAVGNAGTQFEQPCPVGQFSRARPVWHEARQPSQSRARRLRKPPAAVCRCPEAAAAEPASTRPASARSASDPASVITARRHTEDAPVVRRPVPGTASRATPGPSRRGTGSRPACPRSGTPSPPRQVPGRPAGARAHAR